jgi:CDP-diacylglycerol--serine O-phosphatidyltransferase
MVSFGIAPAILAYTWGVRTIAQSDIQEARHIYDLAWLVSLAFALCCAWRLARFNVQGMAPGGLKYFVGMPCPAAAGMIAAVVHAWKVPIGDWRWSAAWLMLVLLLAALMVSTIRFVSFKSIPWGKRQHSLIIVAVGLLVWSVVVYSEIVLLLIAASYTFAGLAIYLVRLVRHRLVSRTA